MTLLIHPRGGHRQTGDIDRMASARVQTVLEAEVASGGSVS
jgi:hypothetical protein